MTKIFPEGEKSLFQSLVKSEVVAKTSSLMTRENTYEKFKACQESKDRQKTLCSDALQYLDLVALQIPEARSSLLRIQEYQFHPNFLYSFGSDQLTKLDGLIKGGFLTPTIVYVSSGN